MPGRLARRGPGPSSSRPPVAAPGLRRRPDSVRRETMPKRGEGPVNGRCGTGHPTGVIGGRGLAQDGRSAFRPGKHQPSLGSGAHADRHGSKPFHESAAARRGMPAGCNSARQTRTTRGDGWPGNVPLRPSGPTLRGQGRSPRHPGSRFGSWRVRPVWGARGKAAGPALVVRAPPPVPGWPDGLRRSEGPVPFPAMVLLRGLFAAGGWVGVGPVLRPESAATAHRVRKSGAAPASGWPR